MLPWTSVLQTNFSYLAPERGWPPSTIYGINFPGLPQYHLSQHTQFSATWGEILKCPLAVVPVSTAERRAGSSDAVCQKSQCLDPRDEIPLFPSSAQPTCSLPVVFLGSSAGWNSLWWPVPSLGAPRPPPQPVSLDLHEASGFKHLSEQSLHDQRHHEIPFGVVSEYEKYHVSCTSKNS